MAKVLKYIWFVSLFGGLAGLLWTYASVPLVVDITNYYNLDREAFFYASLFFLCVANFSLYAISRNNFIGANEGLQIWKYAFGIIINAFYVVSMLFIATFNDTSAYEYDNFGYLIITFLALLIVWTLALPAIVIYSRKK